MALAIVQKYIKLPPMGRVFFRCYLALVFKDNRWLNEASKADVLTMIHCLKFDEDITNAIAQAVESLKDVYREASGQRAILDEIDPHALYANTIGNGCFDLYSAEGLGKCIAKARFLENRDLFCTLADAIGERMIKKLAVPIKFSDAVEGAYLKQNDLHNHFDLVAPVDYLCGDQAAYQLGENDSIYIPVISPLDNEIEGATPEEIVLGEVECLERKEPDVLTGRQLELCALAFVDVCANTGERRPLVLIEPDSQRPHTAFDPVDEERWIGYDELTAERQQQALVIRCEERQGGGIAYAKYTVDGATFVGPDAFFQVLEFGLGGEDTAAHTQRRTELFEHLSLHAERIGELWQRGKAQGLGLECGINSIDEFELGSVLAGTFEPSFAVTPPPSWRGALLSAMQLIAWVTDEVKYIDRQAYEQSAEGFEARRLHSLQQFMVRREAYKTAPPFTPDNNKPSPSNALAATSFTSELTHQATSTLHQEKLHAQDISWPAWLAQKVSSVASTVDTAFDDFLKFANPIKGAEAGVVKKTLADNTDNYTMQINPRSLMSMIRAKCRSFVEDSTQPQFQKNAVQAFLDGRVPGKVALYRSHTVSFTATVVYAAIDCDGGVILFELAKGGSFYINSKGVNSKEFAKYMSVIRVTRPVEEELFDQLNYVSRSRFRGIQEHLQTLRFEPELIPEVISQEVSAVTFNGKFSKRLTYAIEDHSSRVINEIIAALPRAFFPAEHLDNEIRRQILDYEKKHNVKLGLTPASTIVVTSYTYALGRDDASQSVNKISTDYPVVLREFLSGRFDKKFPPNGIAFESDALKKFCLDARHNIRELQDDMLEEVKYFELTSRFSELSILYSGLMNTHCIKLLESPSIDTTSKADIRKFLAGSADGHMLLVNGIPVGNAFFIGEMKETDVKHRSLWELTDRFIGPVGVLIFLGSDRVYRFADSMPLRDVDSLKSLICNSVALRDVDKCRKGFEYIAERSYNFYSIKNHRSPLTLQKGLSLHGTWRALARRCTEQARANTDYLFYTSKEKTTDALVKVGHILLFGVSVPVNMMWGLPLGTAGVIAALISNGLLAAGEISLDGYSLYLVNGTPGETEARKNLICSVLFSSLNMAPGLSLFTLSKMTKASVAIRSLMPNIIKNSALSRAAIKGNRLLENNPMIARLLGENKARINKIAIESPELDMANGMLDQKIFDNRKKFPPPAER